MRIALVNIDYRALPRSPKVVTQWFGGASIAAALFWQVQPAISVLLQPLNAMAAVGKKLPEKTILQKLIIKKLYLCAQNHQNEKRNEHKTF